MNKWMGIGRLVKAPNFRSNEGKSTSVCDFTLAINRPVKTENRASADFIRVVAFGKTAELCDRYLDKGMRVGVEGSIRTGSYEKDGRTVYTTDIVADRVEFLWDSRKGDAQEEERPAAPKDDSIPDDFEMMQEQLPF